MAKKMLKGDASSSSYGYSSKGSGRPNSKVHPRSPSESNLPRRMAFESMGASAESRLGGNLSTSAVNFAPSGGGQVTMLKNRGFYHSRSDFREQEARV